MGYIQFNLFPRGDNWFQIQRTYKHCPFIIQTTKKPHEKSNQNKGPYMNTFTKKFFFIFAVFQATSVVIQCSDVNPDAKRMNELHAFFHNLESCRSLLDEAPNTFVEELAVALSAQMSTIQLAQTLAHQTVTASAEYATKQKQIKNLEPMVKTIEDMLNYEYQQVSPGAVEEDTYPAEGLARHLIRQAREHGIEPKHPEALLHILKGSEEDIRDHINSTEIQERKDLQILLLSDKIRILEKQSR